MFFITHFFVFFSDFQRCINSKILSEMHRCHTQSLFPNSRNTPELQTHTKKVDRNIGTNEVDSTSGRDRVFE